MERRWKEVKGEEGRGGGRRKNRRPRRGNGRGGGREVCAVRDESY